MNTEFRDHGRGGNPLPVSRERCDDAIRAGADHAAR